MSPFKHTCIYVLVTLHTIDLHREWTKVKTVKLYILNCRNEIYCVEKTKSLHVFIKMHYLAPILNFGINLSLFTKSILAVLIVQLIVSGKFIFFFETEVVYFAQALLIASPSGANNSNHCLFAALWLEENNRMHCSHSSTHQNSTFRKQIRL